MNNKPVEVIKSDLPLTYHEWQNVARGDAVVNGCEVRIATNVGWILFPSCTHLSPNHVAYGYKLPYKPKILI